ncbi:MAG: hypothetical protein NXI22_04855 [bacterium]|nr:hypothetical protein [bacterium]
MIDSEKSGDILLPDVLFGSLKETRKRWRKIARAACRSRDWESELDSLQMSPWSESPTEIVIGISVRRTAGKEPSRWFLNWAGDFEESLNYGVEQTVVREFELALLHRRWGVLGLLANVSLISYDYTNEWYESLFRCVIRELSSLIAMQRHFRFGTPLPVEGYFYPDDGAAWFQSRIYYLARRVHPERFSDDPEERECHEIMASLSSNHAQIIMQNESRQLGVDFEPTNVVDVLTRRNLIRRRGDEFELL